MALDCRPWGLAKYQLLKLMWVCSKCETANAADSKVCEVCDSPRSVKSSSLPKKTTPSSPLWRSASDSSKTTATPRPPSKPPIPEPEFTLDPQTKRMLRGILTFMLAIIIIVPVILWLSKGQTSTPVRTYTAPPIPSPTPTTTPIQVSQDDTFLGNIPTLGAQVRSLKFFESSSSDVPFGSRIYSDRFVGQGTRFIMWELLFTMPPPDHRISFEIEAVWSKSSGEVFEKQIHQGYIEPGWSSAYRNAGRGSDIAGEAWLPGKYKVELYISGNLIARSSFEVISKTTSPNEAPGITLGTLPSLNMQSTALRLFESDEPLIPQSSRIYTNKFYRTSTHYICWELQVYIPPTDQPTPLEIIAVWSRDNGEILARYVSTGYISSGTSTSVQNGGWGARVPGQSWLPGSYKVDLYAGGALLGSASFAVFEDIVQKPSSQYQQPNSQTDMITHPDISSNTSSQNEPNNADEIAATNQFVEIYRVEHKHSFGSCMGILQLSRDSMVFASNQHLVQLDKTDIKHLDGPGITDHEGHNWHFKIKNKSDQYVRQLFENWRNNLGVDFSSPYTARILRDLNCATKAYSINYDKQTSIEFVNDTPEPRQVFAVGPNSEMTLYKSLAPYEASVQGSAAGARWLVTDQYGACKGLFIAFGAGAGAALIQK